MLPVGDRVCRNKSRTVYLVIVSYPLHHSLGFARRDDHLRGRQVGVGTGEKQIVRVACNLQRGEQLSSRANEAQAVYCFQGP
jgi:hypothetical protein